MKLNRLVTLIFGPVLILTGIAGFLTPPQASLTSGAAPYNIFHIIFGIIGLLMVFARKPHYFNFGFGLIDIYQAIASYRNLPPKQFFLWTGVDDILHVVLGVGLALLGLYGILKQKEKVR